MCDFYFSKAIIKKKKANTEAVLEQQPWDSSCHPPPHPRHSSFKLPYGEIQVISCLKRKVNCLEEAKAYSIKTGPR